MSLRELQGIVYKEAEGRALHLDLLLPDPPPEGRLPLVVEIHGGAWEYGARGAYRNRFLAERGFATASIDYRLSGEATFPAQLHDCQAAIRWLRAHAAEYGIDPARVGVWGHSAGGHLSALLAASAGVAELDGDPDSPIPTAVQAVVTVAGPTDLIDLRRNEPSDQESVLDRLFGGPLARFERVAALANPITHILQAASRGVLPPFLLLYGAQDGVVPVRQAELLYDALKDAGGQAELVVYPQGGHGLESEAWLSGDWDDPAERVTAFFQRHLA